MLVVLIPLFLGIVQVALVLHVRNTLTSAASEGARYAATVDRPPGAGVERTRQQIRGALAGRFARDVTRASRHHRRRPRRRGRRHGRRAAVGHLGSGGATPRQRPRRGGGRAMTRGPGAPRRARQRAGRGHLAVDPAAGAAGVRRPGGVPGAARCVRGERRDPGRRPCLHACSVSGRGRARARAAAAVALEDQGVSLGGAGYDLTCTPDPRDCLSPGSVIHVRMAYPARCR